MSHLPLWAFYSFQTFFIFIISLNPHSMIIMPFPEIMKARISSIEYLPQILGYGPQLLDFVLVTYPCPRTWWPWKLWYTLTGPFFCIYHLYVQLCFASLVNLTAHFENTLRILSIILHKTKYNIRFSNIAYSPANQHVVWGQHHLYHLGPHPS